MKRGVIWAVALIAVAAAAAWAQDGGTLVFHDKEDGVFVLRHAGLSKAFQAGKDKCRESHAAFKEYERDYGDGVIRESLSLEPLEEIARSLPARTATLARLKEECALKERQAAVMLSEALAPSAGDRLLRSYVSGGLVYVKLRPKTKAEEILDPLTW